MSMRLHPGETVLFQGHPSWRAMLAFHIKGLLVAAGLGLLTGLITGESLATYLVVLIVLLSAVLVGLVRRLATTYTITDHRLNIRRGIISRELQETRLARVQNVSYRQGLLQRLLQIGDVDFDTASMGDDYSFVFAGVADPGEVIHQVDAATGVAGHGAGRCPRSSGSGHAQ